MGINSAVIIDDELLDNQQVILDIINGQYDSEEFEVHSFVQNLGYTIEGLKESDEFPAEIIKEFKKIFPDIVKSEISELLDVVFLLFENDKIRLLDGATENLETDSNTIIFLDYKLKGSALTSERLTKLLAQKETSNSDPRCIVFISKDEYFSLDSTKRFRMLDSKEKSQYFRALRNEHDSKFNKNSLYDYINKKQLITQEKTRNELHMVFQNLYGGQQFFRLLSNVEQILIQSSEAVLGQFHLLNARSIQELIREKVVEEGESAPAFLMQWISRHIAKKVEQNEEVAFKIDQILKNINEWNQSFYEIHEDIALREILLSEMWDTKVNERHLPVDFGDIFEVLYNGEKKRAILLTQTCTLAVRNNGKRTGRVAMLALENPEKFKLQSGVTLDDWEGKKITFDLDETISYPINFLDITTLNFDGKAVIEKENGTSEMSFPTRYLWSDGYKIMIEKLVNNLVDKLLVNRSPLYQIDETWMPYENFSNQQILKFEFPIRRLSRLDQQYALYVFQAAQAWWGRIGLPVNVNFMDDYREVTGTIIVQGKESKGKFFVKRRLNDITDVGVLIDDINDCVKALFEDDDETKSDLERLFTKPELARFHYSSGQKIMSLKSDKTALELLGNNKIYINIISEDQCRIEIIMGKISKCFLEEEDITNHIAGYGMDKEGRIRLKIAKALLEEKNLTELIDRIGNKTNDDEVFGPVVSLSSNDQVFQFELHKNRLNIRVCRDIRVSENIAAAKESYETPE